ncbi:hypothetical protein MMC29_007797 [Sticta canariensis]|nr:hypothetical protein [Sticta canariensis]
MSKLFEETAGFSLGSLAQVDKFLPEPMPLESHAKFIKETWGKSTISIRLPVPNKLSVSLRDLETQFADLERKLSKLSIAQRDLETQIADFKRRSSFVCNEYQLRTFRICRGNLLMDLIKKLLPRKAKKARRRPTIARWSTMAKNYAEADFKKATQNFDVCNDSAHMMRILQGFGTFVAQRNRVTHDRVNMARLLTSSTFREKPNNRFWRRLFEYVYEQTVEEAVQMSGTSSREIGRP